MPNPLMKCGHVANGVNIHTYAPSCVICIGIKPGADEIDTSNSISNRQAICYCGLVATHPREQLAFYEYRGEGSNASKICICGFHRQAHREEPDAYEWILNRPRDYQICMHYTPRGAWEYDAYYCGHSGWD